jgi:hypothetical protein
MHAFPISQAVEPRALAIFLALLDLTKSKLPPFQGLSELLEAKPETDQQDTIRGRTICP